MSSSSVEQNNGGSILTGKLEENISSLSEKWKDLRKKEAEIRLELRRHGGHKGKVDERVLFLLDHVENIRKQLIDAYDCYYSLIMEVKLFQETPSSLLVFYDGDRVDRAPPGLASQVLVNKLVDKISNMILHYLTDPVIRTVSLYGGKGSNCVMRRDETSHFDRIVTGKGFNLSKLRSDIDLVWDSPEELMVSRISLNLMQAGKFFLYHKMYQHRPVLFERVGVPKLRIGNVNLILPFTSSEVDHSLIGSFFKVSEQIVSVTNQVNELQRSASSFLVWHDKNAVGTVFGKYPSHPLIGNSARSVSDKICKYLKDPTIITVGLYGIGGVGKTTIMRNICEELAETKIFDRIIWVTQPKKFDYKRMQDDIAEQLGIKLLENEDLESGAFKIYQNLKAVQKCLFILDDISRTILLCAIGVPNPKRDRCIKIVVVTRTRDICTDMKVDKHIKLAPLSDEEAYELFVRRSGNQVLDPEIEPIAKEIVYECGGLPIAIVTVGHAMRHEVQNTGWRRALEEIRNHKQHMGHIYDVLRFGYNHLKNDQVQRCFLCYGSFPEGYKLETKELIRYWMAEDLLHNEGGIVSVIDDGLEIVRELREANMLEVVTKGGNEWLKMHDLFRELAISIMRMKDKSFVEHSEGYIFSTGERWYKVSFIGNQIDILGIDKRHSSSFSVLLLRDNPLSHVNSSFFLDMPNLQVLDLSYSGITLLPSSVCELAKLRVLFLNFCTSLKKVPPLKKLKGLQVLNLRGTLIKKLPQGIECMAKLISLDLSKTVRLEYIPEGVISSLSNLEELQLQGSRLCKMESPVAAKCFKEIRCLKQLNILTLSAVGFCDHLDTILHLQKHKLKSFSVSVYGSALDDIEDM